MRDIDRFKKVSSPANRTMAEGRVTAVERGVYWIITDGGVRLRAESEFRYRVGERVTVLSGRILGLARSSMVEAIQG